MKRLAVNVIAAGAALTSLSAAAQFQKPEDAIKYRQSVMTVMAIADTAKFTVDRLKRRIF